jgi:hypothetical protein
MLNQNVKAIDKVAGVLEQHLRISGDDVRQIIDEQKRATGK